MSSHWSEYWQQGHVNSFSEGLLCNYDGEIAKGWLHFFKEIDRPGSIVLDLATGNGALIDLAVNVGNFNSPQYIGIDYATLKIPERLKRSTITFYQEQNVESLPFADSAVSVVVSQFGIEYSNVDLTLAEVSRVLRAEGKFRVVVHRENSSIVVPNVQILSVILALQQKNSALAALKLLVESLHGDSCDNAIKESYRQDLNTKLGKLIDQYQQAVYGTDFPKLLKVVMNRRMSFAEKRRIFENYEKNLEYHGFRLSQLLSAAKVADDIGGLERKLERNGFCDIAVCDVKDGTELVGTAISAIKG